MDNIVSTNWHILGSTGPSNPFVILKSKLKALKAELKRWRQVKNSSRNKDHITKDIASVDTKISSTGGDIHLANLRRSLMHELKECRLQETKDLKQKAKVKWAIEGDENSKFFHTIINAKRRASSIKGIKHNGIWLDKPHDIKICFRDYFANKFQRFEGARFNIESDLVRRISSAEACNIESIFSVCEIKDAIWSCGGDKAPGPDGFSFAFVKKYWNILQDDIVNMVADFHSNAYIPVGCNSSFITLLPKVSNPILMSDYRPISLIGIQYKIIAKLLANRLAKVIDSVVSPEQTAFIKGRQILDGPLLLNEVIDWYKAKKKKLMMFKIDFAKAYDSVSWNFLYSMLTKMGFGSKWVAWIHACLSYARSSVLINGSPTEEFSIQRGLRQGDPMAPFLFIIVMEGLHIAFENLVRNGLFTSVKINQVTISHLFYADDVIVVGNWSARNLDNISKALRFFYGISGLKINFEKSSIIGVGVSVVEINRLARKMGCKSEKLPFKYLGIPIGGSSKRVATWEPILAKFKKRLSGWKANLLSIGGRSTLISSVLGSLGNYFFSIFRVPKSVISFLESWRASFFWGGSLKERKIHWSKWDMVLAGRDQGGIGFGSLNAMNLALLYKWRWRGLANQNSLWVRFVSDIHGSDCFLNMTAKSKGLWRNITEAVRHLHEKQAFPRDVICRRIGNGQATRFWKDIWCGEIDFETRFPRLYALEMDKDCMVSDKVHNVAWQWSWRRDLRDGVERIQFNQLADILPNDWAGGDDKWEWKFQGKCFFSVTCVRKFIDQQILPCSSMATRWCKRVPKKINIFSWRLLRNRLPSHVNLFGRGVDVNTVRCNLCDNGYDDTSHIFNCCSYNCAIRDKLSTWIHYTIPTVEPNELVSWYVGLSLTSSKRHTLEAIMFIWWWHIWKERNNSLHNGSHASSSDAFNAIVSTSYLWITNRDRKRSYVWNDWVGNPLATN